MHFRKIFFLASIMIGLILGLYFWKQPCVITVINESRIPLESIYVFMGGEKCFLRNLAPHEKASCSKVVIPEGEIFLSFDLAGRTIHYDGPVFGKPSGGGSSRPVESPPKRVKLQWIIRDQGRVEETRL